MLLKTDKALWKWYTGLAVVFTIIISFNFTKPFGFFRESNPALVAINATYWRDNPDVRRQHIPVASFAFRKDLPPATQFDNTITTFGYAWFAVPYYFLQLTNIPAGPVGLRIFSVLWLVLTLFTVFKLVSRLTHQHTNSKRITFITILLYTLSPVVLWYQVNGYVHETAVLPFYYIGWYFFLRLLQEKTTGWLWLTALVLFIGIQFDWLPFFQGALMSAYLLLSRKEKLPRWMFLVPGASIAAGICYIVYHYTSWSSVNDYFHFMQWKFGTRTVGEEGPSFISFWPSYLNILLFYLISYGILLLWSLIAFIRRKHHPFLLLIVITGILHHIVFWGFSSEHDYATLKMALPIVFIAGLLIGEMKKRMIIISIGVLILFSIAQYFFLHNYSYRKGMYEDEGFSYKAGTAIRAHRTDEIIFLDTDDKYFPQVEFYAGRTYKMASSVDDARKQLLKTDSAGKGVFIEIKNGSVIEYKLESFLPNAKR